MSGNESAPLTRLLQQLLDRNGSHSRAGKEKQANLPVSAAEALRLLPATWNLGGVGKNSAVGTSSSASTSSNEVHKLALRIEGLVKDVDTCREGLQLVRVLLEALPWHVVAAEYAVSWLASALLRIQQPGVLSDAIAVCDILLGVQARSQPEYWRQVGAVNAPKYSLALIEVAERNRTRAEKATALLAIAEQVVIQPSLFRSHAPRLHKLCLATLFEEQTCTEAATLLLARLPLTGKGPDAQAQLWSATLSALLDEARQAWSACSSALTDSTRNREAASRQSSLMSPLPVNDDILATHEGHERLALLLGAPPKAGILPLFLGHASAGLVQLPLDELVSFVLTILGTSFDTSARRGVEATLHATQSALLSQAHMAAFVLCVSIPLPAYYNRHADLLHQSLRHVEQDSPTTRCAALHVIDILQLPSFIDPASNVFVRCTRTCLAQAARLLRSPPQTIQDGQSKAAPSTSSKANKRRRLFDADQVVFRPTRGFVDVGEDELDAVVTAIACLSTCFETLVTYLTPEMHDLAHTTALLILGMAEMALKEADAPLSECLLRALASIVCSARGAVLGLLCPRAANICANGLASPNASTRQAAKVLQNSLADAVHPKLPPKLALRLHVDHDRIGGQMNGIDGKQEPILGDVQLTEDAGARELEALRDVLSVQDDDVEAAPTAASSSESAVDHAMTMPTNNNMARNGSDSSHANLAGLSPDPVKPSKRPITPRIGSPGAAVASLSPDRRGRAASGAASPAAALSSPSSMFRGARRSREGVDSVSAQVVGVEGAADVEAAQAPTEEQHFPPLKTTAAASTSRPTPNYYEEDDDSDFSIPEIDMRSSGEESEADENDDGDGEDKAAL